MAAAPNAISKSMAYVCASFSPDLQHLLLLLLATPTPGGGPTVHDAVALVSGRMMTRVSQTQCLVDALQTELSKEMENGRLLRLLAKLQFVKERQVLGDDTEWGEHSDRYLLRLFSDAVFQQVDEEGRPVVDFAQLVNNFNKLDVGHEGRVLLSGQNDGALLLVSFRDIKAVLERSFEEITALADERGPS
uniref:Pan3 C-terminal knob domain-containing protein n=1 Tax=Chrysotila carterae TaxID=13221 RepID=A0A7S4BC71_CHRCT|mmetsp:Transcript_41184/g.90420  ORF Transcript_41184/g.90420 Transcript_41184/m.90420 type:complete len:190 (+) Transcript_41184:2-571(+)